MAKSMEAPSAGENENFWLESSSWIDAINIGK